MEKNSNRYEERWSVYTGQSCSFRSKLVQSSATIPRRLSALKIYLEINARGWQAYSMPISETLLTRVSYPSRTWIHASSFILESQHACVYTVSPKLSDREGKQKIRDVWPIENEKELIRFEETCFLPSSRWPTLSTVSSWTRRPAVFEIVRDRIPRTEYFHYRSKYYSEISFRFVVGSNIIYRSRIYYRKLKISKILASILFERENLAFMYTSLMLESYSINITIFIYTYLFLTENRS